MAVQLQERDRKILEHVARYRLTTPEVLDRLFFAGQVEARKGVLKRLTKEHLKAEQLFLQRKYYRLSKVSARLLGIHEEAAEPLGVQAKPTQYGILSFCCSRDGQEWPRYTRPEFLKDFPEFGERCIPRNDYFLDYYVDYDGKQARLGQIHVDLIGDYQRLITTCRGMIRAGLEVEGLREVIAEGLFAIGLVTSEEEKKEKILSHLSEKPLECPIRVHVVPELRDIVRSGGEG